MNTTCSFGKCPCESPLTGGMCLEINGDARKGKIGISICRHCLGTGCITPDENFIKLQEKLASIDMLPQGKRDFEIINIARAAAKIINDNLFLNEYAA